MPILSLTLHPAKTSNSNIDPAAQARIRVGQAIHTAEMELDRIAFGNLVWGDRITWPQPGRSSTAKGKSRADIESGLYSSL